MSPNAAQPKNGENHVKQYPQGTDWNLGHLQPVRLLGWLRVLALPLNSPPQRQSAGWAVQASHQNEPAAQVQCQPIPLQKDVSALTDKDRLAVHTTASKPITEADLMCCSVFVMTSDSDANLRIWIKMFQGDSHFLRNGQRTWDTHSIQITAVS